MKYKSDGKNYYIPIYLLTVFVFLSCVTWLLFFNQSYVNDSWQNYATYDFEQEVMIDEDGEEVAVNLISTPEQLAGAFMLEQNGVAADSISSYTTVSGKVYKLKNNIDLSGKNWGPASAFGSGYTFEGNGFVISNLKISTSSGNIGFFSSNAGKIRNVIFTVSKIEATSKSGGVNVGAVAGTNSGTIESVLVYSVDRNSVISGGSAKNSGRIVGGVVGYNTGKVISSKNYVPISGGTHAGGIVGSGSGGTIEKCYNYGNVSCSSKDCLRIGGIVGETLNTNINLCINAANVSGSNSGDSAVGGILGYGNSNVNKCGNTGNVSCSGTYDCYCGGVVGILNGKTINNCYSKGSISASAYGQGYYDTALSHSNNTENVHSDSQTFVIGIYNHYKEWARNWTDGRYSDTHVDITRYVSYSNAFAGGLVGYSARGTVNNSYSKGSVSGGKRTFKDVYANTLTHAYKEHVVHVILGFPIWTYYNESAARVYYDIYSYDYEHYADPISGAGECSVSNCYSSISAKSSRICSAQNYNYKYSYSSSHFLELGSLLVNLINCAFSPDSTCVKEYSINSGNEQSLDTTSFGKSDSCSLSGFDNIYHSVGISGSTVIFGFSFYINGKTYNKSKSQNIIVKSPRNSPSVNSLGASIWGSDSLKNGGDPYIKEMYW